MSRCFCSQFLQFLSHPTIAGGVFWAICCTKFQVKLSLETATVVRTSSILTCDAHPYCLAPFKTKFKRTARVAGRLTHFYAFFSCNQIPPALSWDDSFVTLHAKFQNDSKGQPEKRRWFPRTLSIFSFSPRKSRKTPKIVRKLFLQ